MLFGPVLADGLEGLRHIFDQDLVSRIFNRTSYYCHVTRNLKWDNSWEIITFGFIPRRQVIFNSLFLWWVINCRLFKNLFQREMLVSYWLIGLHGDNWSREYSGSDQDKKTPRVINQKFRFLSWIFIHIYTYNYNISGIFRNYEAFMGFKMIHLT